MWIGSKTRLNCLTISAKSVKYTTLSQIFPNEKRNNSTNRNEILETPAASLKFLAVSQQHRPVPATVQSRRRNRFRCSAVPREIEIRRYGEREKERERRTRVLSREADPVLEDRQRGSTRLHCLPRYLVHRFSSGSCTLFSVSTPPESKGFERFAAGSSVRCGGRCFVVSALVGQIPTWIRWMFLCSFFPRRGTQFSPR